MSPRLAASPLGEKRSRKGVRRAGLPPALKKHPSDYEPKVWNKTVLRVYMRTGDVRARTNQYSQKFLRPLVRPRDRESKICGCEFLRTLRFAFTKTLASK